MTLGRLM